MAKRLSCLVLILAGFSLPIQAKVPEPASHMNLLIWDYAGVSPAVVEKAAGRIAALFREAGVEIVWVNCRQSDGATNVACQRGFDPADYALRILPSGGGLKVKLSRGGGGIAQSGGRNATVFWERIREQANQSGMGEDLMLAAVAAHEIGHLLLPEGYHSIDGLMRARLRREEWRRAEAGGLRFSQEEAQVMRGKLGGIGE